MTIIPPAVLIVRLDAIGDAVTTVPMIAALRRYGLGIGAVLTDRNADVFAPGAIDAVYVARNGKLTPPVPRGAYGVALIATEKPEGYRIARASAATQRIGFENGWGKPVKTLWVRRICTQTVYRTAGLDPNAPHEYEVVFKLAQTLLPDACAPRDPAVLRPVLLDRPPEPDDAIGIQVTDKWERLGADPRDVATLIASVTERNPTRLFGADAERAYCERVSRACNVPVELFDTLRAWKNAIASCRALLAPDSGAVHIAGMIGTPVVACFASAEFALQSARWAPWAAPYQIVRIEGERWPIVAADALRALLNGNRRLYTG